MTTFLTYTILGLVLGSVYSIAASGLVLTYNTSGIFNFAHGAQAMFGTFLYWHCTERWGWPVWLALIVVVGVAAPRWAPPCTPPSCGACAAPPTSRRSS
ncbi:hypothetical protein ACFQY7_28945 [Actinomadura luteofluorescens]|uniref:ABC transporter permease subunit n=1 Tax=Actinomadura luteofluorescens TaxID=46163 RepID=UPI00362FF59D